MRKLRDVTPFHLSNYLSMKCFVLKKKKALLMSSRGDLVNILYI